ncbi:MAG: chemotaxis protein CheC, partial [Clostridiales bacterium]|nr:chemotaxis protein CheC [Clostridiales bacterium]
MVRAYGELGARHIDALGELGNVGAGNAATSLSGLIGDTVRISVPVVTVLGYDDAIRMIGDPEQTAVTVMIGFSGDIRGVVLFIIGIEDAKGIADELIEGAGGDGAGSGNITISDMQLSAVKEIGNIIGSSYLGAVASMAGLDIDIFVPQASADMVGASMGVAMSGFSAGNDGILLIDGNFLTEA